MLHALAAGSQQVRKQCAQCMHWLQEASRSARGKRASYRNAQSHRERAENNSTVTSNCSGTDTVDTSVL